MISCDPYRLVTTTFLACIERDAASICGRPPASDGAIVMSSSFRAPTSTLVPSPKEPSPRHRSTKHNRRKASPDHCRTEHHVQHLHPIPFPAAIDEAIGVVRARELLPLRHRYLQELAERLPALAHLVFEQVLCGHEGADLIVVLLEAAFAVLFEVAFPEGGPEFCAQHAC